MIKILSAKPSAVSQFLHELRDVELQTDRRRFHDNVERLGVIAGYEISRLLHYREHSTKTPLGSAAGQLVDEPLVLATIMRAGLPLQQGIHQVLPMAELAFIGAARKSESAAGVEIELSYVATPPLAGKTLIIADTMIATGQSLVDTWQALTEGYGMPARTIVAGIIASRQGADHVHDSIPGLDLIVAAVDDKLDHNFYIVPGLGDAGDLLYGPKA